MFEVRKEEYVSKTFRLKKELVDELAKCASKKDISVNELVSQRCRYSLDNMEVKHSADCRGFSPLRQQPRVLLVLFVVSSLSCSEPL